MGYEEEWEKWQEAQQYADFDLGPPAKLLYGCILQSKDFQSGKDGWRILPRGDFEVANLKARGEIDTLSFRSNGMNAINGSLLITKSAVLKHEVTPDDAQIMVSDKSFDVGDILYIRLGRQAPNLRRGRRTTDNYEYMHVTAGPDYIEDEETGEGHWLYTVTRNYGTPDEKPRRWRRGTAVVSWVDKQYGAILLAADRDNSPYIDILQRDSTQINSFLSKVRLGRLDGVTDTVLNPRGYGLYADNVFLRGRMAIGGGYSDTAIDIYDTTGNWRGSITQAGEGWFGDYDNFRWDNDGNVTINSLTTESANIIARESLLVRDDCTVKDYLYVEGGVITSGINWDVQNLYVAKSLVVQNDATIKDYLYVQDRIIVGDAEVTGSIDVGSIDCQDAIFRKDILCWDDATVKNDLYVEEGIDVGHIMVRDDILVRNDATVKNDLYVEEGIDVGHIMVRDDILVRDDSTIKGMLRLENQMRDFDVADIKVHQDLFSHQDTTIKGDIWVDLSTGDSLGNPRRGCTMDATVDNWVMRVRNGIITRFAHKNKQTGVI